MGKELITFDENELALIKTTIAKGTTDDQLKLFVQVCMQTGLNPFARQIYAVVRKGEMSIQTSIDGYRLLAQRSGEYQGQDGPYYYDAQKKEWFDFWVESYHPAAAKVGVMRKGFAKYLYAVARFDSYAARYDGKLTNLWAKMPEVMIAKVAEALALRRAFPAELSGIYTKEEMEQADSPVPAQMTTYMQQADEHTVEGEVVEESPEQNNTSSAPHPVQAQTNSQVLSSATAPTASQLHKRSERLFPGKWEEIKNRAHVAGVPNDNLTPEQCAQIKRLLDTAEARRGQQQPQQQAS